MLRTKWKLTSILCLLLVLSTGKITYAAENFSWSDVKPTPSCYTTPDGSTGKMGVTTITEDGKKTTTDIPSCEEANKTFVIVMVNGKYLQTYAGTGADPFIENNRTMIPLRALADGFGFEVAWEQSQGKITLQKDNTSIIMFIGKSEMLVDGKKVKLEDSVPMIKKGVTFLPVRQLAEILGVKVDWDVKTKTATFENKE